MPLALPVYLDNHSTTKPDPRVVDAMLPYLRERFGNAASEHEYGYVARGAVEIAREQVAGLIGAKKDEVVFTSGATESVNLAIKGVAEANSARGRHVITAASEHKAVLDTCAVLERHGFAVTVLPVDSTGKISPSDVERAITRETILVSIMMANNETGVLFDSEAICQIVKERGTVFHVDAVQGAGKLPLDMSKSCIDMVSISGHKLHAPKGVGALYVRKGTKLRPLIVGGHQERGRRAGTENVASCVALGAACQLAAQHLDDENTRVRALRDRLEEKILASVPDSVRNGDRQQRLPNTTNISFQYIEGEGILLLLDRAGIAASSGSACTSGSLEPSHVLKAMGIPFISAHGSIRFSLSHYNNEAEIDYVAAVLPRIVARLREITPFSEKRATF
ncbi:MAG: cysteine desulfurase NifS [Candidatus Krumholzibacteria bacterium]|nr:cysteine desulfurase NifS [Candidatus Krumholzibacteria bacterium]